MRFTTLAGWLQWQESLHPTEIELGLDRVRAVFTRLCPPQLPFKVVTVAGTNGKGSSVAALESILGAAGYRVGAYTSPHLLQYNERIRLAGAAVDDATLVDAFAAVDEARANTSLTYFEFGTLAALRIFCDARPDIVLLEVGLGGRLDAVNVVDADVALITSIGIDHTAWLGPDRESIGREKAGIMRAGRPVVVSDPAPPASLLAVAQALGARLYQAGVDFSYSQQEQGWSWQGRSDGPPLLRPGLPPPGLRGRHQYQNLAGVLMALALLEPGLVVGQQALRDGLLKLSLPGRLQWIPGDIPLLLDVAHNPDGVQQLVAALDQLQAQFQWRGCLRAIVGMMADKDMRAMLACFGTRVGAWYPVNLPVARAADNRQIAALLAELFPATPVQPQADVAQALQAARSNAQPGEVIVVFGSFYTVAEAMAQRL